MENHPLALDMERIKSGLFFIRRMGAPRNGRWRRHTEPDRLVAIGQLAVAWSDPNKYSDYDR